MRLSTPIAVAVVPLALLVAACGGEDDDGGSAQSDGATTTEQASEDHNEADVEFARMMIPHHRQAVEMAVLAPDHAQAPEILDIAERIQGAQDPEIQQMTAWLEEWGEEVPAEDPTGSTTSAGEGHAGDMEDTGDDMAGGSGHGMMSAEDMGALEAASGADFDRMFAEMMIEHHEGAIAMANDEIDGGRHAGAIEMAHAIVEAQEAEITELRAFAAEVSGVSD